MSNDTNVKPPTHGGAGKFAKGNKAAVGRRKKMSEKVGEFRSDLILATSRERVMKIWASVLVRASDPEDKHHLEAVKIALERLMGSANSLDLAEQIVEQARKIDELSELLQKMMDRDPKSLSAFDRERLTSYRSPHDA